MLTPGNRKLGEHLIWGFGLPSGLPDLCVGLSEECLEHCYARHLERLRPDVLAFYERNLRLSRQADFARRVRYFILAHDIPVVRLHVAGDFYDADYAGKWLWVMRRLPKVRFFFYTRSWREESIRAVLEWMAELGNCRVWYSCDRGTGAPAQVPPPVQLAWLMIHSEDVPPAGVALTFRVRALRRQARTRINGVRVCPEEDGVARKVRVTCERCRLCWKPLPEESPRRIALPTLSPSSPVPARDSYPTSQGNGGQVPGQTGPGNTSPAG
jgi:hypothetical protein